VEIKVGSNPPLSPRQQILSAPYALVAGNSATLQGRTWRDFFASDDPASGQVRAAAYADIATNAMLAQSLPAGSVTFANLAPRQVGPSVGAGGVALSAVASNQLVTATSYLDIAELQVSLVSLGRPVYVGLVADSGAFHSVLDLWVYNNAALHAYVALTRNGQNAFENLIGLDAAYAAGNLLQQIWPPSSLHWVDFPTNPGAVITYGIRVKVNSGATLQLVGLRLVAFEL
jgi:hypothetical protein